MVSLSWCRSCVILDNQLQLCHGDVAGIKYKTIKAVGADELNDISETLQKLTALQESLADATKPLPQLIGLCKTPDQVSNASGNLYIILLVVR